MTPRVKICGITRLQDALLAVDLGATAVGFVLWPGSPRYIQPDLAREIVAALPNSVVAVGVFVDEEAGVVRRTAKHVGLGAVQLHGSESVEFAASLLEPVIKAVPIGDDYDVEQIDAIPRTITVLLDAHDPQRRGGTGRTIDWQIARKISERRFVVLAGGITPENAQAAIAAVRPYAIDVSSGVESAPGIKDHRKLRALFDALVVMPA